MSISTGDVADSSVPDATKVSDGRVGTALMVTLILLSATAPLAMDMYLPSWPQIVSDLHTTSTAVQLSLTAFVVGVGVGQAIFGPLSDRYGRFWPLIIGTGVYVLAGVGAALAPSIAWLVAARLVQGFTGAAGMVIGRAIISDCVRGQAAGRAFSILMLVGGIAPVLSPTVGSLLAVATGWRGVFAVVAGIGAVGFVSCLVFVRETNPRVLARRAEEAGVARSSPAEPDVTAGTASSGLVAELFGRRFLGACLAFAFGFGTMMAYISSSSFLFQDVIGLSSIEYGLVFGMNSLILMIVSGVAARLAGHVSPARQSRVGLACNLGAILVMGVIWVAHIPVAWVILPIAVAVGSLGLVLGNTTALALDEVREHAGTGSAVMGVIQFGLAGVIAPLVGGGTIGPLVVVMGVSSVIANGALAVATHERGKVAVP